MKKFIRAEDFSVDEARIVLGGRILEGSSILSAHVERRVSAELLGLYGLILVVGFYLLYPASGNLIVGVGVIAVFVLGAARELYRPWVLVLNIYQIGGFEVRGFTEIEATAAVELVDSLRGGSSAGPGSRTGPW